MATSFAGRKRLRKNFGRLTTAVEMPNLIEVQKSSYEAFLQRDVAIEDRTPTGLQEVFQCVGAGTGLIFARSLTFGLLFLFLWGPSRGDPGGRCIIMCLDRRIVFSRCSPYMASPLWTRCALVTVSLRLSRRSWISYRFYQCADYAIDGDGR